MLVHCLDDVQLGGRHDLLVEELLQELDVVLSLVSEAVMNKRVLLFVVLDNWRRHIVYIVLVAEVGGMASQVQLLEFIFMLSDRVHVLVVGLIQKVLEHSLAVSNWTSKLVLHGVENVCWRIGDLVVGRSDVRTLHLLSHGLILSASERTLGLRHLDGLSLVEEGVLVHDSVGLESLSFGFADRSCNGTDLRGHLLVIGVVLHLDIRTSTGTHIVGGGSGRDLNFPVGQVASLTVVEIGHSLRQMVSGLLVSFCNCHLRSRDSRGFIIPMGRQVDRLALERVSLGHLRAVSQVSVLLLLEVSQSGGVDASGSAVFPNQFVIHGDLRIGAALELTFDALVHLVDARQSQVHLVLLGDVVVHGSIDGSGKHRSLGPFSETGHVGGEPVLIVVVEAQLSGTFTDGQRRNVPSVRRLSDDPRQVHHVVRLVLRIDVDHPQSLFVV